MSGNTIGTLFKITTWGESHGPALGVVVDGCPPGIDLSPADIQVELDKRKPGQSQITTARAESDEIEILSGIFEGKTTGHPISMLVRNSDHKSASYDNIKKVFRPGHADYTYFEKYGIRDYRGGGRSSGRETLARVAGGAIAKKILRQKGIEVIAYTVQIGDIHSPVYPNKLTAEQAIEISNNALRCADAHIANKMEQLILNNKKEGDSTGGVIEIVVSGCPVGLGDPVFDKLNADLGKALLSINAVKGIEFGQGFNVANMTGSLNNDMMRMNSINKFVSNNAGGIIGGISNTNDIVMRIAVKPTSSISKIQQTIDIDNNDVDIMVEGRHDPCIVPRAVVVAESMTAIVILDKLLIQNAYKDLNIS
jgi:chorismate synthase